MFEGLFPLPSTPKQWRAIVTSQPPSPPKLPGYWVERQAESDQFLEWIETSARETRQKARIAALRSDLEAVLGARLDQELADQLAAFRLSETLQQSYANETARFRKFCADSDFCYLPAAAESIAMFIFDVCCDPPDPVLASKLCTAIQLRHRVAGVPDPTDSPFVRALMKWIKGEPLDDQHATQKGN